MRNDSSRTGMVIAAAAFCAYALMPTRDFYWDGVGFAQTIETGMGSAVSLLNPNHLIYNLTGYAAWKGLTTVGVGTRALYVLQAMNALFAAAAVWLVWDILRKLTGSAPRAHWGALLFAFSAQWWKFSGDADAYIPSILFLLVAFRGIMPGQAPKPLAAGFAHGIAMLFHQLAVFFYPAAMTAMLIRRRREEPADRSSLADSAKYCALSAAIASIGYIGAFQAVRRHTANARFWDWITVHSSDASLPIAVYHRLRFSVRGTLRLFFGGRANQVKPDFITVAAISLFALALITLVVWMLRSRPATTAESPQSGGWAVWLQANIPAFVWIATYMAFLVFWLPQNVFYRMFYLPALIFGVASLPVLRAHRIAFLALFATVVCAWNFNVLIYPHAKTESNEVLSFALRNHDTWEPGTAILYSRSHTDLWLINYFNRQAEWATLPATDVAEIERRRSSAAKEMHPLWLEGMAYDAIAAKPDGRQWLSEHVNREASLLYTTPAHNIRYYEIQ